jgi:hypothetical protein
MLNSYDVKYESIYVDDKTVEKILNQIIWILKSQKKKY